MPDQPQPVNPPAATPEAPRITASKDEANESSFSVLVGEVYDGPLDLLLDLIRKQDIDIYDIPIAQITAQYLKYVENMKQLDVDVAAEFIYTASLLIHIKSKMLLPRDPDASGLLEDPRMELVNRLLEHERYRTAAQMLLQKQHIEEAVWTNPALKDSGMQKALSRSWLPMSWTWLERFSRSSIARETSRPSRWKKTTLPSRR